MSPAAHPALVLNADFRPLSYFPLSLWPWQDAVHAVIAERISVVAEYDAVARSPSIEIRLPSVVALLADAAARCVHSVQRVLARSLPLPILRRKVRRAGAHVRSRDPSIRRRRDVLGEHRRILQP